MNNSLTQDDNQKLQEVEPTTCSAKYIFMDVVGFTHGRSVEAQTSIVDVLNKTVLGTLSKLKIAPDEHILIPTGDGICVGLINTEAEYPYDIHMLVALDILESLDTYNANTENVMYQFQVRIGINANEDNLVIDINKNKNLAGAGISVASRIMDKADGNQILVGQSVFDRLQQREQYMDKFQPYRAEVKHGLSLSMYQYIKEGHRGLNISPPSSFIEDRKPEVKVEFITMEQEAHLDKLIHLVKQATHEMLVLDFNPLHEQDSNVRYSEEDRTSEMRRRYYESIIERFRRSKPGTFKYRRVLQVPEGLKLADIISGDQIFQEHCETIIALGDAQPENINLKISSKILHEGSYIIIDSTHLIFDASFLDPITRYNCAGGTFFIEDTAGDLINCYLKFFDRAEAYASIVRHSDLPK
jgi:class 3 adenylate cyclase